MKEALDVKYSEWLEQTGFGNMGFYSDLNYAMVEMLPENTDVFAAVLDEREELEGYNWIKRFILLTADKLITGHIAYRLATDDEPEGLEVVSSSTPLRSIRSVTSRILRTQHRGFPEQQRKYVVEFVDRRPAMILPPDSGRMRSRAFNDYMNLGRMLFQLVR